MTEQDSDRCAVCGELIAFRPGESYMASTDGKVWHMGCAPSRQGSAALPSEAITEEMRDEAYRQAKLCDGDHASTAFEYGWDAAVAAMRATTPTAPVQDDDAELLLAIADDLDLPLGNERRLELRAIASRLSPTPGTGLIEALKAVRPFLVGLTKQGEDNIWRPAERHLTAIDAALANASPAQVESE